ncbi:hypothetical protein XENTR_v10010870 [Xenopus tropicalis]|nr:hypothetical protein XENTR_v10010870 [Xenopus tropicalis]
MAEENSREWRLGFTNGHFNGNMVLETGGSLSYTEGKAQGNEYRRPLPVMASSPESCEVPLLLLLFPKTQLPKCSREFGNRGHS